jgi:Rrf2 family protein
MNFSKTTAYSLNILSYMSRNPDKVMSARYLNRMLSIPYSYLRQVMSNLSTRGFISGSRGRTGGFSLARDVRKIFLSEIIEATEGLENFSKCAMGFDVCPFNHGCSMHPLWVRMRTEFLELLEKTSLAELLVVSKD